MQIKIESPDKNKALILTYEGEVRFGPPYFKVKFAGIDIDPGEILISENVVWSMDSSLVSYAIYNTLDASKSPDIDIIVLDVNLKIIKLKKKIHTANFLIKSLNKYSITLSVFNKNSETMEDILFSI